MNYRLYDFLRGIVPVQQSEEIIFDLTALSLIVGLDKMENIINNINPDIYNSEYFYNIIERETIGKNKTIDTIIKHILEELNKQNLQCKDLLQLIYIILDMDEEEKTEIIDGKNQDEINLIKGVRDYSTSDISWINKLAIELLKQHGGKTLFNADCGTGTFLVMAYNEQLAEKIIGYSYSFSTYMKAKVRSYIKNKKNITVFQKPFFCEPLIEKVDMIYADYPFNLRYELNEIEPMITKWGTSENITFGKRYSSNMLCILNMLESLNDKGIVVAVIPDGGLFNSNDTEIRQYLVEKNYIDTIISLPVGIFPTTGVKTSMLILKKNRIMNDNINMIDASKIYQRQRRHNSFSNENINQIIGLYTHFEENGISFKVSKEEIVENNYNLGLGRYIKNVSPLINPHTLGNVSEKIFRGYQAKASELDAMVTEDVNATDYRIVNISDVMSDGYINDSLNPIMIDNPKKFEKYCLIDGDIVITAKNTTIKTAIYEQKNSEKAILTGNLIAIRLNKRKINPYYLKTFLNSESGQVAIRSIQTGTTLISISPNTLKEMKISVLTMDAQEKLAKEFKDTLKEIKALQNRYDVLAEKIRNIYKI